MSLRTFAVALLLTLAVPALAEDSRQLVTLPDHMRDHMMGSMRDHLTSLQTITRDLSEGRYDEAADVAETHLGMSSLEGHGASHLAKFMPPPMAATGTAMHRAASLSSPMKWRITQASPMRSQAST